VIRTVLRRACPPEQVLGAGDVDVDPLQRQPITGGAGLEQARRHSHRKRDIWVCSAFIGERGGCSSHTSSISDSALRNRPGSSASATSSARARRLGTGSRMPARCTKTTPSSPT